MTPKLADCHTLADALAFGRLAEEALVDFAEKYKALHEQFVNTCGELAEAKLHLSDVCDGAEIVCNSPHSRVY